MPYPTPGDAIGRAFAVSMQTRLPASLRIIQKEVISNMEYDKFSNENGIYSDLLQSPESKWKTLEHWTNQGIFLLNTALTVETGKAGSHLKYWEGFTKSIISYISSEKPCIWILWGAKAQKFRPYIRNQFHVKGYDEETIKEIPGNSELNYILTAPHPAAESYSGGNAGFYGCNHFLFINEILNKIRQTPIIW